jgi:hypothetical protein
VYNVENVWVVDISMVYKYGGYNKI